MRTTLDLPDALVQEAMHVTRIKTKKQLVTLALEELIKRARRKATSVSKLTPPPSEVRTSEQVPQQQLQEVFESLRQQNPFQAIHDPVEWQREQRKDRELPR